MTYQGDRLKGLVEGLADTLQDAITLPCAATDDDQIAQVFQSLKEEFGEISLQNDPRWEKSNTRDAREANFASYRNFGAYLRSSHGVISGITDTVNYSPLCYHRILWMPLALTLLLGVHLA